MTDLEPGEVRIPLILVRPLPWRIREHPEQASETRAILVREALVDLAVRHPPLVETLQRIRRLEPLVQALNGYRLAADAVLPVLGLPHRRALLARDGGALPIRHDPAEIFALAQLRPDLLAGLAHATAVFYTHLDRALYVVAIERAVERIAALQPLHGWLVPSLLRCFHLGLYADAFGPFPTAEGPSARVPVEWEEAAIAEGPRPPRQAGRRAPRADARYLLIHQTRAWWAARVQGASVREVARRWHATMTEKRAHRDKFGSDADPADCGCLKVVRTGLAEVARLLTLSS